MDPEKSRASASLATWTARVTWPLLALTFIGLLGGLHPPNESRDRVLIFAAGAIAGLNLPCVIVVVGSLARGEWRPVMKDLLGLVVRCAVTWSTLTFIHGINLERRPPSDSLSINPSTLRFHDELYQVERLHTDDGGFILTSDRGRLRLDGVPSDARHISPCPEPILLVHDLNRDGQPDLGFYSCSWLELYIDGENSLHATQPVEAKFKNGRWIHIDPSVFPGLNDLSLEFIHTIDPDA